MAEMSTRNILVSILNLTKENNRCSLEDLRAHARMTLADLRWQVEKLAAAGMLRLQENLAVTNPEQRLGMALRALGEGADFERICRLLSWQEFEDITVRSLEANGFSAVKHVVFKSNDARQEVDVVGVRGMLIVCLDCKHWMRGLRGTLAKEIAMAQAKRAQGLASSERARTRLGISTTSALYFVPVVVSLVNAGPRSSCGVPIVSALKLNSFLRSIDPFVEGLFIVKVKGLQIQK